MFETILGLAMLYAWGHGMVIVSKKVKGITGYEKGVLIFGAIVFVLFVVGTLV